MKVLQAALGALAVLAAVLLVVFVHSTRPAEPGAFYSPPTPLPGGPLGTIVRSERVADAPAGARERRILYISTSFTGARTAVSGLLFVPTTAAPPGGRPIAVSTHGTIGVASGCVGSKLGPAYWPAIDGLKQFLAAGYVVAAPDYQGLGTPGPHPYLVGDSEAWAALDAARAARRFAAAGAGERFAVFGASQGGQAALFTGQLAAAYAPELKLVGVAAAAPASDLARLFANNPNSTVTRVLSAYTLDTWSQVYPQLKARQVATAVSLPVIERIAGLCIGIDEKSTISAAVVAQLLRISYLHKKPWETEPWKSLIARNSPGLERIPAPVLITQGDEDKLVTPEITSAFVAGLCRRGQTVSLRTYPGVDHVHAGPQTAPDVAGWIDARFRGQSTPTGCRATRSTASVQ